ncbi:hypothetical protein PCE1_003016 [Barthelona sp. PCE]
MSTHPIEIAEADDLPKSVEVSFKHALPQVPLNIWGLLGFGITTMLLNIHNAFPSHYGFNGLILGHGCMIGCLLQLVSAFLELKARNAFAATAFFSYALFWAALCFSKFFNYAWSTNEADARVAKEFTGWFLAVWGFFTFFMLLILCLKPKGKKNPQLINIFGSLFILFCLLAAGDFLNNTTIGRIAGFEGIYCGFCAFMHGIAALFKHETGYKLLFF